MRILYTLILCLLFVGSCKEAIEVITPKNFSILIRGQYEKNATLVDDFFGNQRIAITAEQLQAKRAQYGERDLFLKHMLESTKPAYGEVVMNSSLPTAFKKVPTTERAAQKMLKHLLPFPSGYTGPSPGSGALDNFAKEILDSINTRVGKKHVLIESYTFGGSSSTTPTETFTLNFEEIKINYQKMLQLISTTTNTGVLDNSIDEMLATATPEEAVLISLLLPAVQKVREGKPYSDLMNLYFDMSSGERNNWNRDARLAAFLCAYDFIISHEYNPKDEFTTSVEVNKAICDGVTVLAWARVN